MSNQQLLREIAQHLATNYLGSEKVNNKIDKYMCCMNQPYHVVFSCSRGGRFEINSMYTESSPQEIVIQPLKFHVSVKKQTNLGYGIVCTTYVVSGGLNFEFEQNMR